MVGRLENLGASRDLKVYPILISSLSLSGRSCHITEILFTGSFKSLKALTFYIVGTEGSRNGIEPGKNCTKQAEALFTLQ